MSNILILTIPPLNIDDNNTFEFLFKNKSVNHNLVSLCCRDGHANSKIVINMYRLSEKKVIKSIFHRKIDIFEKINKNDKNNELNLYSTNNYFHNIKRILRDIVWTLSAWKKSSLSCFIKKNNFDYIIAPSEASHYFLKIVDFICKHSQAKLILYTWDDNFTYKQNQLSPLFYYYRFITRKMLKHIAKKYVYKTISISEKTKVEADKFFGSNSIVIKKQLLPATTKHTANKKINIIYAGNTLNGRLKQLLKFSKILEDNDFSGFTLTIYSKLSSRDKIKFQKCNRTILMDPVEHSKLILEECKSNVGLLIESLNFTKRKIARLSISTKYIDYLSSGLPILAIIDKDSATANEIQKQNLGCVASNTKEIYLALQKIKNPSTLKLQKDYVIEFQKNNTTNKTCLINQIFS